MFRRLRGSRAFRLTAAALSALIFWVFSASPAAAAVAARLRREAEQRQGKARLLTVDEQRAIRGAATWPGPPRGWHFGRGNTGGCGEVNCLSGNQHLSIPVVGYSGKGPSVGLQLYFNSAATVGGGGAQPPISSGWSHSFHVFILGAGSDSVTVVEGDGSRNTYSRNVDGTFTPPAGVFDTLARNGDGTYTLTRKLGVRLNFNAAHRLGTVVDLNNNALTVAYGANGQVSTVTDASSRVLAFAYTGADLLQTVTDPANRQYVLAYDGSSHLDRVTYPSPGGGQAQPCFEFASTSLGTITSFRNRRGHIWTLAYDGTDPQTLVSVTDPNANTLSVNYAARQVTLENANFYEWTVDASGNRKTVTLLQPGFQTPFGTEWDSDGQHNPISYTTAGSNTWTRTFDSQGNVLTITAPNSVVVGAFTYNGLNRPLTAVDGMSHQWSYGYDSGGNLVSVTDPASKTTAYEYSAAGLLTRQTDARGKVTDYTYDQYGNLTSLTDPDVKLTQWSFDLLSRLASRTDALNRTTVYDFDGLDRMTGVDYPTGTDTALAYDAEGNTTSFSDATGTTTRVYDALGRLTSESKSGRTFSYAYDPVGLRTSMTDPDSRQFGYEYLYHRLVRLLLGGSTHAEYTRNADGNIAHQVNPNGTATDMAWDSLGRLTSVSHGPPNIYPGFASFSYAYNNAGLRTGCTELDGSTVSWGYDSRNRLTSDVRTGTNPYAASYALDDVGNWTSRTVNGATTGYTYSNGDRILSAGSVTYSWNDTGTLAGRTVGGVTTSFAWDYDAQFTAISTGQSFTYDAEGRRVSRTAGGTTTTFCFDGSAVVLEKQGGTTSAAYTYGEALLTRGGEVMHTDGHGDLRTVTDGGQNVTATGNYEAYGTLVGGTGSSSTPYQYGATSGYRNDGDAGLMHIGARWYDPAIGRWLSDDTFLGEVESPISRNRYAYCESDPTNQVDPSGNAGEEILVLPKAFPAPPGALLIIGAFALGLAIGTAIDQAIQAAEHTKGKRKSTWNKHTSKPSGAPEKKDVRDTFGKKWGGKNKDRNR